MFVGMTKDDELKKVSYIHTRMENDFRGWVCGISANSISIASHGEQQVIAGGVCSNNQRITFDTPDDIDFEEAFTLHPVVCHTEHCFGAQNAGAPKAVNQDTLKRFVTKASANLDIFKDATCDLAEFDPETDELVALASDYYMRKRIFHIDWYIGKRCNFNCSYCPEWVHDMKSPHMSLETMMGVVHKMEEQLLFALPNRTYAIQLSGGEPIVNPATMPVVKYLHETHNGLVETRIMTNASRSASYMAELNQYSGICVGINLEFFTEAYFKKFIDFLSLRDETSKRLRVHILYLPEYRDRAVSYIEEIAKFSDDVSYWMKPVRDKINGGHLIFTDEDWEILNKYGTRHEPPRFLATQQD